MRAIEKGCRPADNITASKRRSNVLRKYINKIYGVCLLNTIVAVILAVIYMDTNSDTVFAAMSVCEINALLSWMCAE